MTDLHFDVLDSDEEQLAKTITLVTGPTEAVLVDTGFTRAAGHRAVAAVLDSGRRLTTVVVTAGDPDFVFGAEVVQDAFPDARFVAPASVIEHIDRTFAAKLVTWASLDTNLPTRKVTLTPLEASDIPVNDGVLEVHDARLDPADRGWFLFDPASRTLLGGILLFGGVHVWTADTPTPEQRAAWVRALDTMASLEPLRVIAGHRDPHAPDDADVIRWTEDYLLAFERAIGAARAAGGTAADAERALLAAFPDAGMAIAAHIGTSVAMGETSWS